MSHSTRAFFRIVLVTLTGTLCVCSAAADKSLHLLVTPKGTAKFRCKVRAARIPDLEELGQTAFRVTVFGGSSPYSWRLPLYRENNGTNDIAAAQIGTAKADANQGFFITVPTSELSRVASKAPTLNVRSQNGESTTCAASLAAPLARTESFRAAQAAVTR